MKTNKNYKNDWPLNHNILWAGRIYEYRGVGDGNSIIAKINLAKFHGVDG